MKHHPQVQHPDHFLERERTFVGQVNDWLASHLAVLFGMVWTVWVFMAVPLISAALPQWVQDKVFFLSSGWIQLWALPLFVFVGNKLQRSSDAQSDAQHQALTHIASVGDEVKSLIEINNEQTAQILAGQADSALLHAIAKHLGVKVEEPASGG